MGFIILGLISLIINANGWFVIPNIVTYVCFGIGVFLYGYTIIQQNRTVNQIKKRW